MQEAPRRSAEIVRIPLDPHARLRGALRMLQTRLDQQRASLATWQDELSSLCKLSRNLQEGAEACQRSADDLAGRIAAAQLLAAASDRSADRTVAPAKIG